MCNVLPKQSTGLFRRKGSTKTMCCLWGKTLVFPHTPFSAFLHLAVLTHGVTARRRAEYRTSCGVFRLAATRALPSTRKGDASPLTPDFGLQ